VWGLDCSCSPRSNPLALKYCLGWTLPTLKQSMGGVSMERNVKVARAHRAIAWISLAAASLFAALFVKEFFFPAADSSPRGPFSLALVFAALFWLHYAISKAALQNRPWARAASITTAILMLPLFPIWTGFGVYILRYAVRPWAQTTA
jgi:hypothetical protein